MPDQPSETLAQLSGALAAFPTVTEANPVAVGPASPAARAAAAAAAAAGPVRPAPPKDRKLEELLQRIKGISPPAPESPTAQAIADGEFVPLEPASLAEAKLTQGEVEALLIKLLAARTDATGRQISDQLKLPFLVIEQMLGQLKTEQLIVHKGSAVMNDYVYQLTEIGHQRARSLADRSTYFGAAPVVLKDYIASVGAQSLTTQHPKASDLEEAFSDLLINKTMLRRLGPALNSGRGLFLFGPAGNGKSSIAERATRAFGQFIWIPRCISVDGEIIRLFDPVCHDEVPLESNPGLLEPQKVDRRWVRIRRPTIIAGGELTMDNLEVTLNRATGINEAPLQLKSNCGILVIDDFGRQRMGTDELLNRWIVPLEKRCDFLNLASGKKVQVPFDQLIIFSTNLEPKELVDDAFLRRIPYKIEVKDPSEEEFRDLFKLMCPKLGFEYRDEAITYLLDKHFRSVGRAMRCCQPRDLLLQLRNQCLFEGWPLEISNELLDFAVENYFAIVVHSQEHDARLPSRMSSRS
ncbi:MAG TPA: AAA family ATPase [Pirellulales bacterium]|nr:AAA family ATPase [Pirellulales bacterium]